MANQELYNKTYYVPQNVIKSIEVAKASSLNKNGLKRANFIIKNGSLTYQAIKRLKHDFDTNNFIDKNQYALAGGDLMKGFIETILNQERAGVQQSKKAHQTYSVDPNLGIKAYQTPRLNEEEEKKKKEDLQKNAVAVIVNNDNKILLLKRGKGAPWQPSKWSLVGGGIEKGETPQQAVEREITEETGLEMKKFVKTFTIQRKLDSIEHVFACRYDGELTDIELDNAENTNYGWYDVDEMEYLEIVPNLIEYVTLAFTKY